MKKTFVVCILTLSIISVYGNTEKGKSDVMFQLESGITSLDNQAVISIGGSFMYRMASWLDVGLEGSLFHTLERQYEDSLGKSYQAESATTHQFLQPFWKVNEVWELGIKIGTGFQLIQFRYEESYRDDVIWTEKFLDRFIIPSLQVSITAQYHLCPIHSLQFEFGYRHIKKTMSQFSDQTPLRGSLFCKIQYGFRR